MKIYKQLFFLSTLIFFSACKTDKQYEYEVNPVTVTKPGGDKTNRKSTTEFISIAYSDLFGTSIPQSKLINLSIAYSSFGDLKVIEERIIKNLLNDSNVVIPNSPAVNGDTTIFISNSYKKFYNREPTEFEEHYWKELIQNNTNVTPSTIYYAMMTSDEYRFY